jgi:SAM-dependent methyltransferase
MQRQGTLQFWDDYHMDHTGQEWISKPSDEVLQMIFDQFYNHYHGNDYDDNCFNNYNNNNTSQPLHVLEIGCGTSSLVRDVKEYFGKQYLKQQQVCRNIHACGTDVSQICIDYLCKRDCHLIVQHKNENNNNNNNNNNNGLLEYNVLNVVDKVTSTRKWDLILDKGCLDTFLFRSRQRGPNSDYNDLIQKVLNNLHTLLKPRSGLYMFISPRSKIKAVRDYQGFSSTHRYTLPASLLSTLEGTKHDSGYLFVCTRNDDYIPGVTFPFRGQPNQNTSSDDYDDDDATCPSCGVSFLRFRNGESLPGRRGTAVWIRQWEGHCKHCQGVNQYGLL